MDFMNVHDEFNDFIWVNDGFIMKLHGKMDWLKGTSTVQLKLEVFSIYNTMDGIIETV